VQAAFQSRKFQQKIKVYRAMQKNRELTEKQNMLKSLIPAAYIQSIQSKSFTIYALKLPLAAKSGSPH